MADDRSRALRRDIFEVTNERYRKCLDATMSCAEPVIAAHSVQRANALSRIAVNSHVYQPKGRIRGSNLACGLEKVGCREASIFTGMCAQHDLEIFKPIDADPLVPENPQQLFLFAYRAVTKTLHDVMEAARHMQLICDRLVARGERPGPLAFEAAQQCLTSWHLWKYREEYFDRDLRSGLYSNVRHSIFNIKDQQPLVAASTFFFIDRKRYGQPFAGISINVVPSADTETVVVFSYAKKHSGQARKYIAPIIMSAGEQQRYELSCLLLNNAENFFVSPRAVESWLPHKRRSIERAWAAALPTEGIVAERVPELMLFDALADAQPDPASARRRLERHDLAAVAAKGHHPACAPIAGAEVAQGLVRGRAVRSGR